MLKAVLSHCIKSSIYQARATYIRGYWPEPLTQQTLNQFLHEQPKPLINIGLKLEQQKPSNKKGKKRPTELTQAEVSVDDVFGALTVDTEMPALDYDDARVEDQALVDLAVHSNIFRDLFGTTYTPDRQYIKFTPEQAERLDKLVPYYWITDQPFARVDRNPKEPEPVYYFNPVIGVSAKFINQSEDDLVAQNSFYGNIIAASDALSKPAITLDGKALLQNRNDDNSIISESNFDNWHSGQVKMMNFGEKCDKYYSVALVNLDYLHENSANLHWMLANITAQNKNEISKYDEICDYLPVHGIEGFGYSRYVFLVFQHDSRLDSEKLRIEGFSPDLRKFDTKLFLSNHESINMVPVGLSWFQTTWDITSNSVFHNYLKMKAPVYEYVQEKLVPIAKQAYPGRIPFNIFLDHERNPKDINEQVLLERLKTVDPFDYKDQYVPPKVPPTVFEDPGIPSWMASVMLKKKNKIGYWRGLRPASATLPLNNNADLDYPIRPAVPASKDPPGWHNQYRAKTRPKMHKDMPTSKPVNEHEAVYVQESHEGYLKDVEKIMNEFKKEEK